MGNINEKIKKIETELNDVNLENVSTKALTTEEEIDIYLAGYAAGSEGVTLEPDKTISGTVQPMRLTIPWWP